MRSSNGRERPQAHLASPDPLLYVILISNAFPEIEFANFRSATLDIMV